MLLTINTTQLKQLFNNSKKIFLVKVKQLKDYHSVLTEIKNNIYGVMIYQHSNKIKIDMYLIQYQDKLIIMDDLDNDSNSLKLEMYIKNKAYYEKQIISPFWDNINNLMNAYNLISEDVLFANTHDINKIIANVLFNQERHPSIKIDWYKQATYLIMWLKEKNTFREFHKLIFNEKTRWLTFYLDENNSKIKLIYQLEIKQD